MGVNGGEAKMLAKAGLIYQNNFVWCCFKAIFCGLQVYLTPIWSFAVFLNGDIRLNCYILVQEFYIIRCWIYPRWKIDFCFCKWKESSSKMKTSLIKRVLISHSVSALLPFPHPHPPTPHNLDKGNPHFPMCWSLPNPMVLTMALAVINN